MKLNYSHKRVITTADLYDATDPPLIFEVRSRPPQPWASLYNEFERDGMIDADVARQLIAMVFLTVSDGENTYPMDTPESVQALQEAIEENNPGHGNDFSCNIAWAFGRHYYSFLGDHLGNSLKPSQQSNGSAGEKTPALVS